ncbi:MAG: sensor histidine kinase [Ignavibacteriales bacterium]
MIKQHLTEVEWLLSSLQTLKHEHTRHIQTVLAMIHLNEIGKAKEYLNGIADSYWPAHDLVNAGNPTLTALLNSRHKMAEAKKVDFEFAIKCNVSEYAIPSWDFASILGNLLDNAFESAVCDEDNKRVSLEIKNENEQLIIFINNTGPKITENQKSMMFRPGYTTKSSKGRGFGLFIVKKLVNSYGGEITVITEPKTTFIVSLPARGETQYDNKDGLDYGNLVRKSAAIQ